MTRACQAPLSVGFPRQEYWSGLPFPSSGDLPNPRIEPMLSALAGRFFTTEPPGKPSLLLQFNSVAQSCPSLCNPWTAAHQTPLSFTISQSLRKLMSVESEIPSNHLILCRPLLNLPSIFPSICHHPHVTSGKTLTLTRRPLLASLLSSSNSIPLHPQS